jgi:hypothetical protein
VRKVVKAEPGSVVTVLPPDIRVSDSPSSIPIRIVDDKNAQGYRQIDPNATHTLRQMDVVREVKNALPSGQKFNSFDVLAIRRVNNIDKNLKFVYKPIFSSPQYSIGFAKWIVDQFKNDQHFFRKTRAKYRSLFQ